jgi:hypothetical protein
MLTNSCLSKDGYIINQGKLKAIQYGKYTSDYNGCGWIATYNAVKLMGEKEEVENIISYLNHYTIVKGKFGTNPIGIKKYLKKKKFKLKSTFRINKFNDYAKHSYEGIVLYLWNGSCHYVAFQKSGEQYRFLNEIYGKEDDIRTMKDFIKDAGVNIAYLITIR